MVSMVGGYCCYFYFILPKQAFIVLSIGTGKSSIVCAMCLGLAGHTKLLGRANEVC